MLDEDSDVGVNGFVHMSDCRLVTWQGLPTTEANKIFPDLICLGGMSVEFDSTDMSVYRYRDAAGNYAFAFDKGDGLVSHGSQILSSDTISNLKQMGAKVSA
jgi:hypothetical protein